MNIISIVGISATDLYTLYGAAQAFLRVALTNWEYFVGSNALPLFGAADGMRRTRTYLLWTPKWLVSCLWHLRCRQGLKKFGCSQWNALPCRCFRVLHLFSGSFKFLKSLVQQKFHSQGHFQTFPDTTVKKLGTCGCEPQASGGDSRVVRSLDAFSRVWVRNHLQTWHKLWGENFPALKESWSVVISRGRTRVTLLD